jgi:hypothetical protein
MRIKLIVLKANANIYHSLSTLLQVNLTDDNIQQYIILKCAGPR